MAFSPIEPLYEELMGRTGQPFGPQNKSAKSAKALIGMAILFLGWQLASDAAPFATTQPVTRVRLTSVTFHGTATPNGLPTVAWFEWGSSTNYGEKTSQINIGEGSSVVWVHTDITGLVPGRTYHFRIVAKNSQNVVYGANQSFVCRKRVSAWGCNDCGQTNALSGLSNVVAVAAGGHHTLALKDDGLVAAWGNNASGQTSVPTDLTGVVSISAGHDHSLALKDDGTVIAWGRNEYNQCDVPLGLSNVVAISAGQYHNVALKDDGTVAVWGWTNYNKLGVPPGLSNVVAVAAGGHTLALKNDGTVVAWGWNGHGQVSVPAGLSNVVAIAAGDIHSLALKSDGTLVGWGWNGYNLVTGAAALNKVVAVSAGYFHSIALQSDGKVVVWGANNFGQTNVPAGLTAVAGISATHDHTVVIADNFPPKASPVSISGEPTADLIVSLAGTDRNGDAFSFKIVSLPLHGALYQYDKGGRGTPILDSDTLVEDPAGRVVFALPATIDFASPFESFRFTASDGQFETSPETATVTLIIHGVPHTTTEPATHVEETSATLNGMVTPLSSATAWFVWGTGTSYERQTPEINIGSGNAAVWVTNRLTGLVPGQTYRCRLVASNSVGIAYGAERSFCFGKKVFGWGDNRSGQTKLLNITGNALAIAAGKAHSLVLTERGDVIALGDNYRGQTNVPPQLKAMGIGAGPEHSLAITTGGTVVGWGAGWRGQTTIPAGLKDVTSVGGGYSYSLALKKDGTLAIWGEGSPPPPGASNIAAIAAGYYHCLALKNDGTVIAWGDNACGQTNVPPNLTSVVAVAAGIYHSVALRSDGTVAVWGANDLGQQEIPAGLCEVIGIAAGGHHTVAFRRDGTAVGWGANQAGESNIPLVLSDIIDVAAGTSHNLALGSELSQEVTLYATTEPATVSGTNATMNGAVTPGIASAVWFRWGTNSSYGNETVPINVGTAGNVVWVSTTISGLVPGQTYQYQVVASNMAGVVYGANQTFACGKKVTVWGENGYGQCNVPDGVGSAVGIAGGNAHSLALRENGTVAAWGCNAYGNLNIPSGLRNVIAVAAGHRFSLALRNDGTVAAWGDNSCGATDVGWLADVVAVTGGYNHGLALTRAGGVFGWGYNNCGQAYVPAHLKNVVGISAGYTHSIALRNDGIVVAWGWNDLGQLNVPAGLSNVVSIAAGFHHNLALRRDGTVAAWGDDRYRQCRVPDGLANVVQISAGCYSSIALKADGELVVWGDEIAPPFNLSNVTAVAHGCAHSLALGCNFPPSANALSITASANSDAVITLSGADPNGDPLLMRIVSLPVAGTLYQYNEGSRGAPILAPNTCVTDIGKRVIFAPIEDEYGMPYARFQYTACDECLISSPATVSISVPGDPRAITLPVTLRTPTSVRLNGIAVPKMPALSWFNWGPGIAYENHTTPRMLGVGGNLILVSEEITGLHPDQVIYYQLVVSNAAGVAFGADQLFSPVARSWGWGNVSAPPFGGSNLVALSGGRSFTLGLRNDGTVVSCGSNSTATVIPWGLNNVLKIAACHTHCIALRQDGMVTVWGDLKAGAPTNLTDVVAVSGGIGHCLALKKDGTLVGWGDRGAINVPSGLSNVVAIASGDMHNVALKKDGTVFTWGSGNGWGQLNTPTGLSNVVAIAAGYYHSLALKMDGTVVAWGANACGQSAVPANLTGVIAVAAGASHSMALRGNHTLVAWGDNSYGQCSIPVGISNVVAIAAGEYHSLALAKNGKPAAAATTVSGLPNTDVTIILPASDPNNDPLTFKIRSLPQRGKLYQCFAGWRGDAIVDPDTPLSDSSGRVIFAPEPDSYGLAYASLQFSAGDGMSESTPATVTLNIVKAPEAITEAATSLTASNALLNGLATANGFPAIAWFEWGTSTAYGNRTAVVDIGAGSDPVRLTNLVTGLQAGNSYNFRLVVSNAVTVTYGANQAFRLVPPYAFTQPATMVVGGQATLNGMITPNGQTTLVWFEWGSSAAYGNRTQPALTGAGYGVRSITNQIAGLSPGVLYHFRVVASNSYGIAFGVDQSFAFGRTVRAWGEDSYVPPHLKDIVAIAEGGSHRMALSGNGIVSAWGWDGYGQATPPNDLTNAIAIAGGWYHSLAIRSDGTVAAWGVASGERYFGQTAVPAELTKVVAIAAGGQHSLALRNNGTLAAWGNNEFGQCTIPAGLSNVVAIAGGFGHSLALKNDGTAAGWGWNGFGQAAVPWRLGNITAIASGYFHSMALKSDGTVVAWGDNGHGQSTVPTGLSNVVAIAAGGYHSLALLNDGRIVAWGDNTSGQAVTPPNLSNAAAIASGWFHNLALVDTKPPGVETQHATILSATSAALHGLVRPNSLPTVSWFQFGTTTNYAFVSASTNSSPGLSQTSIEVRIEDLQPSTTYHYQCVASNLAGMTFGKDSMFTTAIASISSMAHDLAGFHFSGDGCSNSSFSVWTTTNLIDWVRIGTPARPNEARFLFDDPDATNYSSRFYRLRSP